MITSAIKKQISDYCSISLKILIMVFQTWKSVIMERKKESNSTVSFIADVS